MCVDREGGGEDGCEDTEGASVATQRRLCSASQHCRVAQHAQLDIIPPSHTVQQAHVQPPQPVQNCE